METHKMQVLVDSVNKVYEGGYYEGQDIPDGFEVISDVPDDQWPPTEYLWHRYQYIGPDGSDWVPYVSPEQLLQNNTATRATLRAVADEATYGMVDAYVCGILSDADKATFELWAPYKLALGKVDLTQTNPAWPVAPQT